MVIVLPPPWVPVPDSPSCTWPIDPGCLGPEWTDAPPEVMTRSIVFASETLRRLTGYRVGGCPTTLRPCSGGCCPPYLTPNDHMIPGSIGPRINNNGDWINCCGHRDCTCTVIGAINLPAPVGGVGEVKIDGVVLDPTEYRVWGTQLIRNGDEGWPINQDLSLPDTEPGTFSVTYLNAFAIDALGAYAAGVLANEFAKACSGSTKCRLPSSVQSVSRQGVTFTMPTGLFADGLTGIREVDAYVAIWNPNGIQQAPKVYSPDLFR
jgi:hypothetical protein